MSDALERRVIFRELLGKSSTFTNHPWEMVLRLIDVYILEMEDVLFHHNSAVMMPQAPAGASSQDGTEDDATDPMDAIIREGQESVTGIRALGLVFRQLEYAPDNKLIVVGHTDTSGQAGYNFDLSDLRAQNVLYLLTGERDEWADVCYGKQKVEDYQQILKYCFTHPERQWPCDPGDINNVWGPSTRNGIEVFIERYNRDYADVQVPPAEHIPPDTLSIIERDGQKRWTREMWKAVYDLYSQDLGEFFDGGAADLESARTQLFENDENWVDPENRFLGCGESFPIDDSEKNNYRSQSNRRVVILFFDSDEVPEIDCPANRTRVHKEEECPLWHGWHFNPLYIDSLDLNAVIYHLDFKFFSRVENDRVSVPAGLQIQAFENGNQPLPTVSRVRDGVYHVKVQFRTPPDDGTHTSLHFEFQTTNKWVRVESRGSTPVIETKTQTEINAMSWDERQQYYDLPAEWSSRNYWTRYGGDFTDGERFEEVFNEILELKPVGEDTTEADEPLVFSLDDIVIVNAHRRQTAQDKQRSGANITGGLNDDSRYSLIFIDYDTMETVGSTSENFRRLTIHNPDEQYPFYTAGPFTTNLITDVPGNTRLIYFCGTFHDVYDKRSVMAAGGCDFSTGQVLGARLAVPNDPELHAFEALSARNETHRNNGYSFTDTNQQVGNYQIHYLHHCGDLDDKPLSCLLLYWSCRLYREDHELGGSRDPVPQARPIDVENHRRFGMTNAMARLNRDYVIVPKTADEEIYIRGFHYMEAMPPNNNGGHMNRCNIVQDYIPGSSPRSSPGAFMMFDTSQLRQRDAHGDPNYFAGGPRSIPPPLPPPPAPPPTPPSTPDPNNMKQDVDGETYWVLTNHHEFGHATGSLDDYLYSLSAGGESYSGIPSFHQPYTAPGGPYSTDILARMKENRSPRMRNFWKYVHWVNNNAGSRLSRWLSGRTHQLKWDFQDIHGSDQTIELDLTNARYCDTSKPAYTGLNTRNGTTGRMDLLLYKIGGETAHTLHDDHVFDGILAIRILFILDFSRGFWDWINGRSWELNRKVNWIETHIKQPINEQNDFYLSGPSGNDFETTLLLFRPFFWVGSSPPLTRHFEVEINRSGNEFETDGDELEVGNNVGEERIARYALGKSAAGDFAPNDFRDIARWMDNQLGLSAGSFSVVRL
jgi:hypothetical protein